MKYFIRFISLFTLIFTTIFTPVSAYALDDSCITKRGYFNDCDNITINKDGLNATAKYIADSDEGCFYFYMKFIDSVMSKGDKIHFKFTISNELEAISFDIDENGFASYTSQNTLSKINAVSKFKIVTTDNVGSAVIGFEIKDKSYRKLLNNISCVYYCGNKRFVKILNNIELDMHKETPTTIKSTTSRKHGSTKDRKKTSVTDGAGKGTTQAVTKFVPKNFTGTQTTAQNTTKFAANGTQSNAGAQSGTAAGNASLSDDEYWNGAMADVNTEASSTSQISSQSFKTSGIAKYLLILGIIVIVAGISVIIAGVSKKDNKSHNEQDLSEDNSE